jgi:hypothetical protein
MRLIRLCGESVFPVYLGLVAQNRVQKRAMNFDLSIVADEAELAELIHEKLTRDRVEPSQRFLADVDADPLLASFLAEILPSRGRALCAWLA